MCSSDLTRVVRDSSGQKVRISSRSVLAQAITGTSANKVSLKWSWYASFGAPWITSIGGQGPRGAQGWNFRVNGLYLARAANNVNLGRGDRVTWYWGKEFATVLVITAPSTGIAPGAAVDPGTFTATVSEVTSKNVRTPSAGATVTYGTATATTGADGRLSTPVSIPEDLGGRHFGAVGVDANAVRDGLSGIAGGRQELARLGRVVLIGRIVGVIELAVALQLVAARHVHPAGPERLDDRVAVDGERQRLAHARVLELRVARVELHHAHARDRSADDVEVAAAGDGGGLVGRHVRDQLEVAAGQAGDARR